MSVLAAVTTPNAENSESKYTPENNAIPAIKVFLMNKILTIYELHRYKLLCFL